MTMMEEWRTRSGYREVPSWLPSLLILSHINIEGCEISALEAIRGDKY